MFFDACVLFVQSVLVFGTILGVLDYVLSKKKSYTGIPPEYKKTYGLFGMGSRYFAVTDKYKIPLTEEEYRTVRNQKIPTLRATFYTGWLTKNAYLTEIKIKKS